MKNAHRIGRLIVAALVMAWPAAGAIGKEAKNKAPAAKSAAPAGVTLNACGCYRKGNACVCTDKKAKCECPEDCEPVGCDEKRQKEMDREMAAEIKRGQEQDKKRQADEAAREQKSAAGQEGDGEGQGQADDQTDETPAEKAPAEKAPVKPSKPARKDREKK
jgi:hypothetical protein